MPTLADWLEQEPFTLTMSSGFFGFFAHCGMLSALEESQLLPQKVTGSSAGALIASLWASGLDTSCIKENLFKLKKEDFWDPGLGLGLLKGRLFQKILTNMLPVKHFSQCRIKCAISAFNGYKFKTQILEKGELIPATYASCAVPFLFQPLWLNQQPLWDGGISDRPGLAPVAPGERVLYHHLTSRSPWRRKNSSALLLPQKKNLASLAIHSLPRSGPNKLEVGPFAYTKAKQATQKALERKLEHNTIEIHFS